MESTKVNVHGEDAYPQGQIESRVTIADCLREEEITECEVMNSSPTAPAFMVGGGSPETDADMVCQDTPEFIKKHGRNRICFKETLSFIERTPEISKEASLEELAELEPRMDAQELEHKSSDNGRLESCTEEGKGCSPIMCINAGGEDLLFGSSSIINADVFFVGGETIRTEEKIGEGECPSMYQTARFGDFCYKFDSLPEGNYVVDLHFAEIVFSNGPAGLRVFNVFVQEEKVLSNIDIYALVGSNKPLVCSGLRATVEGDNGLAIRFEQVSGAPLVCGIFVWKDSLEGQKSLSFEHQWPTQWRSDEGNEELLEGRFTGCDCTDQRQVSKLKRDYAKLLKEHQESKRVLEELKKEIHLKDRECQEAWASLQELQSELLRKSMHVGSLAFAVEGQVKEKSLWFSYLTEISEKFKILKNEHQKLLNETQECNRFFKEAMNMTSSIQSIVSNHAGLEREHEDLKAKFIKGAKEQKHLYNKVLEMKGNIRVFCRCRPLNKEEVETGASVALDFESAKDGELTVRANGGTKKLFKFDAVFSPEADQAEVFEDTAPFAASVLDGYNVCIFAYGQTGTGKTYTMEGAVEARGVNYRTLEELFRIMSERQGLFKYEMSVSVLEVYNEQIRDLLGSTSQPGQSAKRLEIRQVADGVQHVPGLVEAKVTNMNEVWEVLQTGSNARAVGSTNANEHSSRSHCIHCVMVRGENLVNGDCTSSKLWLVDLAGSERVAKTDVQGERLKEAQNINKSLSALGDVISSLATKSSHVPYRNSKLTHLLQDSLGGDSKALMFVQVSPNENDVSETLCSLNFASRVRGVELGPARKQLNSDELCKYKQMVEKSKQDAKAKDTQINKLEETVLCLEVKMRARDSNNKILQDRVKELESELLLGRKSMRQQVDIKTTESQSSHQFTKPPLARQFTTQRNLCEALPLSKNLLNVVQHISENNSSNLQEVTSDYNSGYLKQHPLSMQKENRDANIMDRQPIAKRTGRASICTTAQRIPIVSAPRRISLIPLHSMRNNGLPILPSTSTQNTNISMVPPTPLGRISPNGLTTPCSFRGSRSGVRRPSIVLRRSIHMKMKMKSPMQLHRGIEKTRVSIGGGKLGTAQRVLVSDVKGAKFMPQRQQLEKVKERPWNHGITSGKRRFI